MKLLDNKGRIFGKINIIDLFFLLLVLCIAVGSFVRIQRDSLRTGKEQNIEIVVHLEEVRQATVAALEIGDVLNFYDKNVRFGAIKEKRISPFKTTLQTEKGTLILADVPEKYNLDLVFEAQAIVGKDVIGVSGEHVRIGNPVYLKNKKISIEGHIFEIHAGE